MLESKSYIKSRLAQIHMGTEIAELQVWVEEMAQLVKRLPHKCKNLCSGPENTYEKLGLPVITTMEGGASLASWPYLYDKLHSQ